MQLRLPEIFCDAKQAIEDCLENNKLILSKYNSTMMNMCEVTHFHIEEKGNEYIGNMKLLISYKERIITKYDKFETLNKTQVLTILTTKGDPIWPYIMTVKVWNGEYPSAVAINEETGVVYLLYLRMGSLGLTEFALLQDNQLECIKESLNEVSPYRIKLDENSMFKVLGEIEGNKCLYETLFIEFDCGVKFRVYGDKKLSV
jgi:hypothetical protein